MTQNIEFFHAPLTIGHTGKAGPGTQNPQAETPGRDPEAGFQTRDPEIRDPGNLRPRHQGPRDTRPRHPGSQNRVPHNRHPRPRSRIPRAGPLEPNLRHRFLVPRPAPQSELTPIVKQILIIKS